MCPPPPDPRHPNPDSQASCESQSSSFISDQLHVPSRIQQPRPTIATVTIHVLLWCTRPYVRDPSSNRRRAGTVRSGYIKDPGSEISLSEGDRLQAYIIRNRVGTQKGQHHMISSEEITAPCTKPWEGLSSG
ncbi:unnamed protein product [Lota lota]